jgi:asparagine synthase (glutamine-hydrolysing)
MFFNELNIEIKVEFQKGFQWFVSDKIWFIGYFYDTNDHYISGNEALVKISSIISFPDIKDQLAEFNGVFSVIIRSDEEVILFSDKSRFFPIFYSHINTKLLITDDFFSLINQQSELTFNNEAVSQFLSGAFVSGSDTIVSNINQVRPSELVCISDESIKRTYTSTFSVRTETILKCDVPSLEEMAYEKFQKAGKRLANSLKNKQVLLPLSGGYDSRLIACWLKEYNIENVICFTFGRKGTAEVEISKKVAEQLGFEWYYIEYTTELVKGYLESAEFQEYYKYVSRGTSMFYMQEYFAMLELIKRNSIGNNFVALPGHSGDFLGGSQLFKAIPSELNIRNPEQLLFKKSFWQQAISAKDKAKIVMQIENQLQEIKLTFSSDADYSILEDWLIKERITKYVFNSSQVFTFFGGEIRFPFWDNELFEFWKLVPKEYRLFKNTYNKVLSEKYFKPLKIEFGKSLQPSKKDLLIQKIKSKFKQVLPYAVKNKYRKKNDWVMYDEITQPMIKELGDSDIKINDNGLSYLHRILNWYLFKIAKEYEIKNNSKL